MKFTKILGVIMKKYNILALWLGCLTIFGLDANDIKLKSSDGKEFVVMLKDDKTVLVVINNFVYNFKTDGAKITIENFKQGK